MAAFEVSGAHPDWLRRIVYDPRGLPPSASLENPTPDAAAIMNIMFARAQEWDSNRHVEARYKHLGVESPKAKTTLVAILGEHILY